jgi:hypothetical protein
MRWLVALASVCALAGCKKESSWTRDEVPHDRIDVVAEKMLVKSGEVGHDQWKSDATYVLVEARNESDRDAEVTLGGALTAADGSALGTLRKESIRIPAGGSRLFALVDAEQLARPGATSARIDVLGAMPVEYPPPYVVTDGHVYSDQGRAVVAGNVTNTADRPGSAVIVAAFFDEAGRPMQRPSTLFKLDPKGTRGTQFVGPVGSKSAYLFIGEVSY